MNQIDWIILIVTLCTVLIYGVYKSRGQKNLESYFLGNRSMPWYIILFSIMGTQASAITFLSAPGQAYTDGMRFVQYYFGLPLAMIVLCITFVPLFQKLKVYTAYEYLEVRFDRKTRLLTSFLFLLQRGLSTGISIYAPSIILSSLMGWNIYLTNIFMGGLLIIYTVSGGVKAIAYTQRQQLLIIFSAMFLAGYMVVHLMPENIGFTDALHIAGKSGKLNVITTGFESGSFDWKDKYNLFSGIIGGFFLALSYFGTDQSQVGRYIGSPDISSARSGLLMNGMVKVPMQFLILMVGALVFSFYCTYKGPVYYNKSFLEKTHNSIYSSELAAVEKEYESVQQQKKALVLSMGDAISADQNTLHQLENRSLELRKDASAVIRKANPGADVNDTNYIFLYFVINTLPAGLVGLIIAIIFLAAWGSIAAALNSLASCSIIDWHSKSSAMSDKKQLRLSRLYTAGWGIFSIIIAQTAGQMGSLIEAVNILGSLFYGTILGIFVVAFYIKKIKGNAVFIAALIAEVFVVMIYLLDIVSFLWLNAIGCFLVILFAIPLNYYNLKTKKAHP